MVELLTHAHQTVDKVEKAPTEHGHSSNATNEAQDLLRQHSNLWAKGNSADTTGMLGGFHIADHETGGTSGGVKDWSQLKKEAGAAGKESADHGKALGDLTEHNKSEAKTIDDQTKANTSLGNDAHSVVNTWTQTFNRDGKHPLTKQNLEGMATYFKESNRPDKDTVLKSIDNVRNNWNKMSDMTDGGAGKSISNRSIDAGLSSRQQTVDGEKKDLAKNVETERKMETDQKQDEQAAHDAARGLTPSKELLDASKVQKGDGYYQVAQRMLGLDHQKHTDTEVKDLVKVLKEQMAADKRSPALGQSLVDSQNFASIMDRIRGQQTPVVGPDTAAVINH